MKIHQPIFGYLHPSMTMETPSDRARPPGGDPQVRRGDPRDGRWKRLGAGARAPRRRVARNGGTEILLGEFWGALDVA